MTDDADREDSGGEPKPPIAFYFDFSSPYGYLAALKIDDMARLYGRAVDWKPVLLGVIFKTTGAQPLLDVPVKGDYARRDIARMARLHGAPFQLPEVMPFPSIPAARSVYWAKDRDPEQSIALAKALYVRAFGEGGDIRDADAVIEVAGSVGIDTDALRTALGDDAVKTRLKVEMEQAIQAGVCGSPFFLVDEEPFWGVDRLDHVERWLATGGW